MVAVFLWPSGADRISVGSYEKITTGMTLEEVESILGGPGTEPDQVEAKRRGPPREKLDVRKQGSLGNRENDDLAFVLFWLGNDAEIVLRFGGDKRVTDKIVVTLTRPSAIEWVKYWLGA